VSSALSLEYLYDAMYANMILLGFAWQKGLVPVSLRGLYRAIKLNGVAIDDNVLAFDLGRLAAHDPARLKAMVPVRTPPPEKTLDELIAHRAAHLTAYQNAAYGERYKAAVAKVRARETALGLGEALSRAVAVNLSKLMSYKDEYEVARLYADPAYEAGLRDILTGPMRFKVWLSPPLLAPKDPHTGLPRKMAFGGWVLGLFKVLQHGKVLRGGPLDVFGKTAERAMERGLRDRYLADLDGWLDALSPATHKTLVELASLPDQIRGFGHVKEASVAVSDAKRAVLMGGLAPVRA
jgi:indolepyruvate ferredoxin oxidoreductase